MNSISSRLYGFISALLLMALTACRGSAIEVKVSHRPLGGNMANRQFLRRIKPSAGRTILVLASMAVLSACGVDWEGDAASNYGSGWVPTQSCVAPPPSLVSWWPGDGDATKCKDPHIVAIDINPQSCPNLLNVKSKDVLSVTILGTMDFDVTEIDVASVRLEGVAPFRSAVEDVAFPFEPFTGKTEATDCTDLGPDGLPDLTLKFNKQAIVQALGVVADGDVRVLALTATLTDGTGIQGEDIVVIVKKGKK